MQKREESVDQGFYYKSEKMDLESREWERSIYGWKNKTTTKCAELQLG